MNDRQRWNSRSIRRACEEMRAMTGVKVRSSSSLADDCSSVVVLEVS